MMVPTEEKLELSKAVNTNYDKIGPNGKKDKLYVLNQRRRKVLVDFKNKLFSLMIGAKFLEEYFVCHCQYNMHPALNNLAYPKLKFDKSSCTPDDKAVIVGKFLLNTSNMGAKWTRVEPENLSLQSTETQYNYTNILNAVYKVLPYVFARRMQYADCEVNNVLLPDDSFMGIKHSVGEFVDYGHFYDRTKNKGKKKKDWFQFHKFARFSLKENWDLLTTGPILRQALKNEYLLVLELGYNIYDLSKEDLVEKLRLILGQGSSKVSPKKKKAPLAIAQEEKEEEEDQAVDSEYDAENNDEGGSDASSEPRIPRKRPRPQNYAAQQTSSRRQKKRKNIMTKLIIQRQLLLLLLLLHQFPRQLLLLLPRQLLLLLPRQLSRQLSRQLPRQLPRQLLIRHQIILFNHLQGQKGIKGRHQWDLPLLQVT